MKNSQLKILPVIHHIDGSLSLEQADLALALGADGIFLISHQQNDDPLISLARMIQRRHPAARIGVNLLSSRFHQAFDRIIDRGEPVVDALWADNADVDSSGPGHVSSAVSAAIGHFKRPMKVFASVAFKYQRPEANPAAAAVRCRGPWLHSYDKRAGDRRSSSNRKDYCHAASIRHRRTFGDCKWHDT